MQPASIAPFLPDLSGCPVMPKGICCLGQLNKATSLGQITHHQWVFQMCVVASCNLFCFFSSLRKGFIGSEVSRTILPKQKSTLSKCLYSTQIQQDNYWKKCYTMWATTHKIINSKFNKTLQIACFTASSCFCPSGLCCTLLFKDETCLLIQYSNWAST